MTIGTNQGEAQNVRVVGADGSSSAPATESQLEQTNDLLSNIVLALTNQPTVSQKPARIARTAHLASAALPAAGAFTNQTAFTVPDGVAFITFFVTYTSAAVAGQPKFRILVSNGTEEYPIGIVDSTVTTSEPFSRQPLRPAEFLGPIPGNGVTTTFTVPVALRGGETTIRLLAAEHGATGTPGTASIVLTAAYG